MLDGIKQKYSASDLAYHIIVPSLPGYAYSSGPPIDKDAAMTDMSRICNKFMEALGFDDGYVAQGGDLGSMVSRQSAGHFDACKAYHLNMVHTPPPKNADQLEVQEIEKRAKPRGDTWLDTGTAYGQEHGTRTATIGLVLSSSPIAMLAWYAIYFLPVCILEETVLTSLVRIGEKFLQWSDEDPPLEQILESVTLYWLTDTFPRCIYPYRSVCGHHTFLDQ